MSSKAEHDQKRIKRQKKKFLEKLEEVLSYGTAARAIGVTHRTISNWRNADPEFDEACIEIKESMKDDLELSAFQEAIGTKVIDEKTGKVRFEGGNALMKIFLLKTQVADRGYIEKKQLSVDNGSGQPIIFLPSQIKDMDEAEIVDTKLIEGSDQKSDQ